MTAKIYGVTELNNRIKAIIDSDAELASVFVRGELSNYKIYPSGHHYFTMKDQDGTLRAVLFKREASKLRFRPENGMKVIAFGRVTVFPARRAVSALLLGAQPRRNGRPARRV